MAVARLIWDAPASGAWNMAVDEALLRSATATNRATLRFYQWSEPTLSLGYFQQAAARRCHAASGGCPVVRRVTGGGAIIHDRELTYSLVLPQARVDHRSSSLWYDTVHQALIQVLASFQVPAYLCPDTERSLEHRFLCFQRRAKGDVLLDCRRATARWSRPAAGPDDPGRAPPGPDIKIVGSAQRRRREALLQHGSILLARSPAAPELPGIAQYADAPLDVSEFGRRLVLQLTRANGLSFRREEMAPREKEVSRRLCEEQFASEKWTLKR